jgi:hypothetical protein
MAAAKAGMIHHLLTAGAKLVKIRKMLSETLQ